MGLRCKSPYGVLGFRVLSSTHRGFYTLNPKGSLIVEFYLFFYYYFNVFSEFFFKDEDSNFRYYGCKLFYCPSSSTISLHLRGSLRAVPTSMHT
jgi:hypothetical protein